MYCTITYVYDINYKIATIIFELQDSTIISVTRLDEVTQTKLIRYSVETDDFNELIVCYSLAECPHIFSPYIKFQVFIFLFTTRCASLQFAALSIAYYIV